MKTPDPLWIFGTIAALALGAVLFIVPTVSQPAPSVHGGEFPADWFTPSTPQEAQLQPKLVGLPMPALDLSEWRNGEISSDEMKGKVIVIDFWATWCAPCLAAVPSNNDLMEKYHAADVRIIGICTNTGQQLYDQIIKQTQPKYPLARDADQKTMTAWSAMSYPTYAVVDRKGILRAIGLKHDSIAPVVDKLLAEPAH